MENTTALSTEEVVLFCVDGSEGRSCTFCILLKTLVYEDDTTCFGSDNVLGGRERAEEIEIWNHFALEVIQRRVQNGHIKLVASLTRRPESVPVDILTKPLHLMQ
jgi:hypothetical protein